MRLMPLRQVKLRLQAPYLLRRWCAVASLVLLGLLASATAGSAAPPRVTLRLEKATVREALLALSRETGIPMQIRYEGSDTGPRVDLSWSGAQLSMVLADLEKAYSIRRGDSSHGGYPFYPSRQFPIEPAKPDPEILAGREIVISKFRLAVTKHLRSRKGLPEQVLGHSGTLFLQVDFERPEEISRECMVRAVDTAGWDYAAPLDVRSSFRTRVRRQEYNAVAELGWLGKESRRLRKVTVVFPKEEVKIQRAEFVLPLTQANSEKTAGDVTVEIAVAGRVPPEEREALRADEEAWMVHTNIRCGDHLSVESVERTPWVAPILQGASGRFYWPWNVRRGNRNPIPGRLSNLAIYSGVTERIQSLIYRYAEVRPSTDRHVFEMGDLDLPPEELWTRSVDGDLPPGVIPEGQEPTRSFQATGGGTLVIRGLPARSRVRIGLQLQEAGRWSGIRWTHLETDAEGVARYTSLRPGRYRVTLAGSSARTAEATVSAKGETALRSEPK